MGRTVDNAPYHVLSLQYFFSPWEQVLDVDGLMRLLCIFESYICISSLSSRPVAARLS
jgi:hypothetical protein